MPRSLPLLLVLCGLPFAGKSTLAHALEKDYAFFRVSYDELWQQEHAQSGLSLPFETLTARADTLLGIALARGECVVYDTLNDTLAWRNQLRALAAAHQARFVLIYLNTPPEVLATRRQQSAQTSDRHPVSSENLHRAHAKFEPPTPDEAALHFFPHSDLATLVLTL